MTPSDTHTPASASATGGIGVFEKWLSIWVGVAIVLGTTLGALAPDAFAALARLEIARVNLPVAVLIWLMVFPMMVNIDLSSLRRIGARPKGLAITLIVN